jgi:hypothetical protein
MSCAGVDEVVDRPEFESAPIVYRTPVSFGLPTYSRVALSVPLAG